MTSSAGEAIVETMRLAWLTLLAATGCSRLFGLDEPVRPSDAAVDAADANEQARHAYLGLERSIATAVQLGIDGFNTASSSNITPQSAAGLRDGSITVTGQVDQGASSTKEMRLYVRMAGYDDGDVPVALGETMHIIYNTQLAMEQQPSLQLKLTDIPTGTLSGSLTSNALGTGVYQLTGDVTGQLKLNLTIMGTLEGGAGNSITLKPFATKVVGTATHESGGQHPVSMMF